MIYIIYNICIYVTYIHITQVQDAILKEVSRSGWVNGPYSDDNLASKKLYDAYQHKATNSKTWHT